MATNISTRVDLTYSQLLLIAISVAEVPVPKTLETTKSLLLAILVAVNTNHDQFYTYHYRNDYHQSNIRYSKDLLDLVMSIIIPLVMF